MSMKKVFAGLLMILLLCSGMFTSMAGFIPTGSMEPTIRAGSFFIGSRLAHRSQSVQRGDIIVFRHMDVIYVKRVVGLGGEKLSFIDGKVYADGQLLDEREYLQDETVTNSPAEHVTVPPECFFVMGDNRRNSYDSRYWENPFVEESSVMGRCLFWVSWPDVVYKWMEGYTVEQIIRMVQLLHIAIFVVVTAYLGVEWCRVENRKELATGRLFLSVALWCSVAVWKLNSFIP